MNIDCRSRVELAPDEHCDRFRYTNESLFHVFFYRCEHKCSDVKTVSYHWLPPPGWEEEYRALKAREQNINNKKLKNVKVDTPLALSEQPEINN